MRTETNSYFEKAFSQVGKDCRMLYPTEHYTYHDEYFNPATEKWVGCENVGPGLFVQKEHLAYRRRYSADVPSIDQSVESMKAAYDKRNESTQIPIFNAGDGYRITLQSEGLFADDEYCSNLDPVYPKWVKVTSLERKPELVYRRRVPAVGQFWRTRIGRIAVVTFPEESHMKLGWKKQVLVDIDGTASPYNISVEGYASCKNFQWSGEESVMDLVEYLPDHCTISAPGKLNPDCRCPSCDANKKGDTQSLLEKKMKSSLGELLRDILMGFPERN